MVQRQPDGTEVSVPSQDFYCHHYILGLRSALYRPPAGMEEGQGGDGGEAEMEAEQRQHARAHDRAPPSEEEVEEGATRERQHRFPLPSPGGGRRAGPSLLRGQESERYGSRPEAFVLVIAPLDWYFWGLTPHFSCLPQPQHSDRAARRRRRRPPTSTPIEGHATTSSAVATTPELRVVSSAISLKAETIPYVQVFCEGTWMDGWMNGR